MYETIRRSRAVYGCHFYGNEVSSYGKENGYVDYRTFVKAFDAVMNNSIMQELESAGFYFEPIQDGTPDNSDEIDELREKADEFEERAENKEEEADDLEAEAEAAEDDGDEDRADDLRVHAEEKRKNAENYRAEAEKNRDEADDLETQEAPEIFQFFIVDDAGAEIIQEWTDDPLFYCSALDMYIWGVTHWGTSWDYVLTDIRINAGEEALN